MALYTARPSNVFLGKNINKFKCYSLTHICQKHVAPVIKDGGNDDQMEQNRRLETQFKTVKERGYLRSLKPYSPPENVSSIILNICESFTLQEGSFGDAQTKYNVLKECYRVLNHSVPNSFLHKINNIDDLYTFYKNPVSATVPLDEMKSFQLPKNLHVIYDYTRFHPETDTKFGGISAFPEASTVVTNLKAKKKYPGFDGRKRSL